ncbi:NAD(P)-binding Rossmann-like domain [Haematococcus lacustris]|uniref:NAD(P)-binding Rossmann-like domain n=1 Tax=Haematococcus lacustris TaxID=44745 RepID=A0A6A0A461_HAELA|nr:NAD(P)-binding Rossmann-like domain [Haematococcus lacustris]
MEMRVAIVGAGLSGAVAASTLAKRGVAVTLFDLGRNSPDQGLQVQPAAAEPTCGGTPAARCGQCGGGSPSVHKAVNLDPHG